MTDLGSEWLYTEENSQAPFLEDADLIGRAADNLDTYYTGSQYYMQTVNDEGVKVATLMSDNDVDAMDERLWGEFLNYKKDLLKALGDVNYSGEIDT